MTDIKTLLERCREIIFRDCGAYTPTAIPEQQRLLSDLDSAIQQLKVVEVKIKEWSVGEHYIVLVNESGQVILRGERTGRWYGALQEDARSLNGSVIQEAK